MGQDFGGAASAYLPVRAGGETGPRPVRPLPSSCWPSADTRPRGGHAATGRPRCDPMNPITVFAVAIAIVFVVAALTACLSPDAERRQDALRVMDKAAELIARLCGKKPKR